VAFQIVNAALFRKCLSVVLTCVCFTWAQLQFSGNIPPEVNTLSIAAEYNRIYGIVAPRQRPDHLPLKIIYFTKGNKPLQADALPEWGGGGSIGGNLVVIPTDSKPFLQRDFYQITVHEMVHSILYRAYPGLKIPRWFNEGTAMVLSGELSFEETSIISKAVFFNRLFLLPEIDSVNEFGKSRAELAYSQSHAAILFLVGQYGMEIIPECLNAARKKHDFYAGINAAIGLDSVELEELIHNHIASKYRIAFLVSDSYFWWVLIAVLFIAGFIVTIKRNRKRAGAMQAREDYEAEVQRRIEENKALKGLEENKSSENENPPPPTTKNN
jgi:hypothetical protein